MRTVTGLNQKEIAELKRLHKKLVVGKATEREMERAMELQRKDKAVSRN